MSVAILLFAALPLMLVFPITISSAHATEDSSNSEVALNIDSVINISSPSSAAFDCAPGTATIPSSLCTTVATIGVSTNNVSGYTLQMNITPGYPTDLTGSSAIPGATLPTINQAYTPANFPANSWGYTGGLDKSGETGGYNCAINYCPVLAYQTNKFNYSPNHTIKQTDTPTTASSTNITFGAKIDLSKPFGAYSTSVTFTAIANNVSPPTKLVDGLAMQEVTSSVCANSDTDQTYTLVDVRGDSTNYTVAKLQDGNCWMTQNLALGGSTAMNLTQADSNVGPSGFTLPASVSVSASGWTGSYTDPEFLDYAGNNENVTKYGNYYNWPAATAGTNPSSGDSQYDICPKNWRLPSASSTSATDSEFYIMLNNYITSGSWSGFTWSGVTTTQFTNAPVSLVFSGYNYYSVANQGDYGTWWSATIDPFDNVYILDVSSNGNISPRSLTDKNNGYSIRCLIPGT